jgi:uncharacterized protein (TIRG00374 family)
VQPEVGASAPRRTLRPLLRLLFQLLLIALAGWLAGRVVGSVGWSELSERLRTASWPFTLLALSLLVARFVVWDARWRLAFRRLGDPPSPWHSFFTLLGSACANTITPTARLVGGLLRARYLSFAADRTFGHVFGVVVFDQLAHQVVLVITGWLAFAGMAWLLGHPTMATGAVAALVVAAAVFGRWLKGLQSGTGRLAAILDRRASALDAGAFRSVYAHGREAVAVVRRLLGMPELRRAALVLGIVYVLLNALAQWALFHAIGRPTDVLTVLLAVTVGIAAGAFTGTPGGVGTTEAGMVLAYVALEVPQVDAAAATVFYRGLHYIVVLALGLPALLVFEARLRKRVREEVTT